MRWMRLTVCESLMVSAFLSGGTVSRAQSPAELNVMPLPASVKSGEGVLKIDAAFRVSYSGYHEPRLDRAAQRFMVQLHRRTGIVFAAQGANSAGAMLKIATDHESKPVQELG